MNALNHPLFEQPWPEGEYRFFQTGFVVDDVVAAAENWARVFKVGPFDIGPVHDQHHIYRGEPTTVTCRVGVAQAGPVQIELIQQLCDHPSVYRELSRDGACSFHQLATVTQHYDEKKAYYEDLGYETASEVHAGKIRLALIDTLADFGFYTEIVDAPPGFLVHLGKVAAASESWDGTDPVHLRSPR